MAKIHEEVVLIKLSKLIRDNDGSEQYIANNELSETLRTVSEELAGTGVVVEVERAQ